MNFNVKYSSFIECYICFKSDLGSGEMFIKLKAIPRPGDLISVKLPNNASRYYEVNRIVHCTQHAKGGEIKAGEVQIYCTELTDKERIEKLS